MAAVRGRQGVLREVGPVLLCAVPFTAVWGYALYGNVLGPATYAIPLGIGGLLLGLLGLQDILQLKQRALLALLAFVAVGLNITFLTREIGDVGLDAQTGLKIGTWIVLLGVSVLHGHRLLPILADPVIALFAAFALAACASAAWSPVPVYTAGCAVGLLAYLGFSVLIAATVSERMVVAVLIGGLAAFLLLTWFAALAFPSSAWLPPYEKPVYRLQGISGHPNILAKQAAVFILLVIAARQRGHMKRLLSWALLGLGFVTLLATNSRTALLALVFAWILVELRSRRLLLAGIAASIVLLGLVVLAGSTGILPSIDVLLGSASRSGDASEVLTLTGRTELWGFVWEKILQRPLQGYGFNAFGPIMSRAWYGNEDAGAEAHNSFLQALFTVGLLGTVPFVSAFIVLLRRWIKQPNALRDLFTSYILIAGATEAELTSLPVLLTLAAFLAFALDAAARSPTREYETT